MAKDAQVTSVNNQKPQPNAADELFNNALKIVSEESGIAMDDLTDDSCFTVSTSLLE